MFRCAFRSLHRSSGERDSTDRLHRSVGNGFARHKWARRPIHRWRCAAYVGGHPHPGAGVAAGAVYIASGMPVVRARHAEEIALAVKPRAQMPTVYIVRIAGIVEE
ncbi:hypothetical protein MNVI_29570 [Mycobacterium noviomagense]|uniref:Uncharacterized protein n=1 Tax=Mycobacterium noviomagense TaxID=459858 RepID=A0A7I7PGH7_9MYCO|nr:hypothetical protein MNVI_29570 [Mycobacterium noviomagense]